jgi:hypothetical protein
MIKEKIYDGNVIVQQVKSQKTLYVITRNILGEFSLYDYSTKKKHVNNKDYYTMNKKLNKLYSDDMQMEIEESEEWNIEQTKYPM